MRLQLCACCRSLCATLVDLVIHQLNAEDAGRLGAALAEGPFGPFLHQSSLDGPVHVVGVQGSNGQNCLPGWAHCEPWGVHGGASCCRGWPAVIARHRVYSLEMPLQCLEGMAQEECKAAMGKTALVAAPGVSPDESARLALRFLLRTACKAMLSALAATCIPVCLELQTYASCNLVTG